MKTWKKWTAGEERVITDQITRNANNVSEGLKKAAVLLDRTYLSCKGHWYLVMLKREDTAPCFATIGFKTKNINRKVVSSKTTDNTEKTTITWWRKIVKLLLNK